jgi:hypothetical protein
MCELCPCRSRPLDLAPDRSPAYVRGCTGRSQRRRLPSPHPQQQKKESVRALSYVLAVPNITTALDHPHFLIHPSEIRLRPSIASVVTRTTFSSCWVAACHHWFILNRTDRAACVRDKPSGLGRIIIVYVLSLLTRASSVDTWSSSSPVAAAIACGSYRTGRAKDTCMLCRKDLRPVTTELRPHIPACPASPSHLESSS